MTRQCGTCDANGREGVSFGGKPHGTCRVNGPRHVEIKSDFDDKIGRCIGEFDWMPLDGWCFRYVRMETPPAVAVRVGQPEIV